METEQTLWERLFSGETAATALAVSHRRPVLQRADRIVVMRDGAVDVITTSVDDALERSSEFRSLWKGWLESDD